MDKTTLGSSAILGIQSVSFFLIKTSLILTSTHPTEHPHIWPLTSEIQMILTSCLAMLLTSTPHSDTTGARIFFLIRLWNPSFKFIRLQWKARHNLLLELLDFRVSSESLPPTFPGRKMDEVWLQVYNKKQFDDGQLTHIFIFKTLLLLLSSFNILIWAIALCSHAACKNFAGLFVVRLVLGMCEGSITAGFLIVSAMFYTRNEQTRRVGYWCKSLFFTFFSHSRWCDETDFIGLLVLMNGTGADSTFFLLHSSSLSLPCSSDYFRLYQLRDSPYQHRRI